MIQDIEKTESWLSPLQQLNLIGAPLEKAPLMKRNSGTIHAGITSQPGGGEREQRIVETENGISSQLPTLVFPSTPKTKWHNIFFLHVNFYII